VQCGRAEMRLATFMALAVFASLTAGLVTLFSGGGAAAAFWNAVLVLAGLQLAYFVVILVRTFFGARRDDD